MILSPLEYMMAKRYLLPGKGERFITMVAGISLVAVMLGVGALIVVMSVMNGFRAELFDKSVGLNGHAIIQGYDGKLSDWREILEEAKKTDGVIEATPLIDQPLLSTFNGRAEAVLVRGMTVENIRNNPTLEGKTIVGDMNDITEGSERIAIGAGLARNIGATVGQTITIINPQGRPTPFGTVPREIPYEIGAIFEIGIYDYDKALVILPMKDAQLLLLMGDDVGLIEIKTNDADNVDEIVKPLAEKYIDEAQIVNWKTLNSSLFEALAVERVVMFVILSIIILNAAFNILSSLIMLVRAKTRDIAILRTMGASRRSLLKIFITVGTLIGTLGVAAGTAIGFIFLYFRQNVVNFVEWATGQNLWDPSIRVLVELPSKTEPAEVIGICVLAILLSFLATLYPAFKAANTDPVQVLRYE